MDSELLPLGLAFKLIGALALCFGVLVAAAWFLRRRWPGLARLGVPEQKRAGLTVIESRGLAPGTSLHLLEVEGTRILVLQTKERGDVLWTRESTDASFETLADEIPPAIPLPPPQPLPRAAASRLAPRPAPVPVEMPLPHASGAKRASASPTAAERNRELELHRERQRRYRERRKTGSRPSQGRS